VEFKGRTLAAAIVATCAFAASASAANAGTVTVCDTGCDAATITGGIAAAAGGDTVQVQAGTYEENVAVNKSVTLRGRSPGADPRNNTTILDADPFARIREIKASQNVPTWGSAQLVQGMLAEGLVDELVLLYSPIVLGAGKRLYADGARHDLRVVESTPLEGGMLALRLAAAR